MNHTPILCLQVKQHGTAGPWLTLHALLSGAQLYALVPEPAAPKASSPSLLAQAPAAPTPAAEPGSPARARSAYRPPMQVQAAPAAQSAQPAPVLPPQPAPVQQAPPAPTLPWPVVPASVPLAAQPTAPMAMPGVRRVQQGKAGASGGASAGTSPAGMAPSGSGSGSGFGGGKGGGRKQKGVGYADDKARELCGCAGEWVARGGAQGQLQRVPLAGG